METFTRNNREMQVRTTDHRLFQRAYRIDICPAVFESVIRRRGRPGTAADRSSLPQGTGENWSIGVSENRAGADLYQWCSSENLVGRIMMCRNFSIFSTRFWDMSMASTCWDITIQRGK